MRQDGGCCHGEKQQKLESLPELNQLSLPPRARPRVPQETEAASVPKKVQDM